MIWLWVAIWVIVVTLAIGLAFLLVVGRAFGRRQGAAARGFPEFALGPGRYVCKDDPWVVFVGSWAFWIALGAIAIWLFGR